MSQPSREDLEVALAAYTDPYLHGDLVAAGCVRDVQMDGDQAQAKIVLGYPASGISAALAGELEALLCAVPGVASAVVDVSSRIATHTVQQGVEPLKNVKNIIAVASGKGGVGKSTVAVNLALALAAEGAQVGMLDADIYGPSQPRMLGISGQPDSNDGKRLEPMMGYGIQAMSIGFLVEEETPMIWRGPMVTQALEQLLKDTNWRDIDYLIIDLPPGTGDIQLTLSQRIPVSGAVIVTTPQDIALLDARKGLKMFEKVNVPVLGIVENMAVHVCGNCGHAEHIFGSGGGERMATQFEVPFLGSLPLDIRVRADVDAGQPTVIKDPEGELAQSFRQIARATAARLSVQAKDYSQAFPSIVIQ
ncbi:MAG: ATP-binding protein involved in chromosome partitioning [Gammaproteobacteria bacterium]|jgi:ATP-binding protein involved in chromosome partitioning